QSFEIAHDLYGRAKTLNFKLYGSGLTFWTDRFPPEVVSAHAGSPPAHLIFHTEFDGQRPKKTLAGTVKTYGLTVNDREVISADDYLLGETFVRHRIGAPVGAVFLVIGGISLFRWNRRRRDRTVGSSV